MPDPSSLLYFAHRCVSHKGETYYTTASPNRWWVEIHGFDEPIVTVRIRERTPADPPSPYWGWIASDEPDKYMFVWPSECQLDMCFPYGPKAEEARGEGRKVNLVVTEIPPGA